MADIYDDEMPDDIGDFFESVTFVSDKLYPERLGRRGTVGLRRFWVRLGRDGLEPCMSGDADAFLVEEVL
jgi:hypothetical protein